MVKVFNFTHFCPPGTGEMKGVTQKTQKPSREYFKKNIENPFLLFETSSLLLCP